MTNNEFKKLQNTMFGSRLNLDGTSKIPGLENIVISEEIKKDFENFKI